MTRTLLCLLLSVVAGCGKTESTQTMGDPRIADEAILAKVVKGTSTKEDIERFFGKPAHVGYTSKGNLEWQYLYVEARVDHTSTEIILPFRGEVHYLTVVFDSAGIVLDATKETERG